MKKTIVLLSVILLAVSVTALTFAEEESIIATRHNKLIKQLIRPMPTKKIPTPKSTAVKAENMANAFAQDNPYFIEKGKAILPSTSAASVTYYDSGRVKAMTYNIGTLQWGYFQETVTYNFLDDPSNQMASVAERKTPSMSPSYDISYYEGTNKVKSVSYAENLFGSFATYNYNSDGTLQSRETYATTGANYGRKLYLSERKEYAYTYYDGTVLVKSATRTTTTYAFDTGSVRSTAAETEYFDRNGAAMSAPTADTVNKDELFQKTAISEKIVKSKSSLPAGVKIVGDLGSQENQPREGKE